MIKNHIANSLNNSSNIEKPKKTAAHKNMLTSLIRLSELGIFFVNDLIINISNNKNDHKLQALDYTQAINKANGKTKKGKPLKVFDIVRNCALDCIQASATLVQPTAINIDNFSDSVTVSSLVENTINNLPTVTKLYRHISKKKNKKEFVFIEKC